mgnify:CR=1 FL=1
MTDDLRDVDDVRAEPDEIDAAWMTAALEQAGVARGARVTEVHVQGFIGTGQTGRNARLALQWDDPDGRPATVVGKFASADPNARLAAFTNGTYQNEWAFYHHLAHTLHIRTPQCHVARFDGSVPSFVLIMEDIAGARQGDQIEGLTLDQARLTIGQAVGLHAPRWGDPTLADFAPDRPKGDDAAAALGMVYQMMVEPFTAGVYFTFLPETSLPSATIMLCGRCLNSWLSNSSRRVTIATFWFGTSTPTSDFPGMGASIRIGWAASASARSLLNVVMRVSFTPRAGLKENCVTVGPTRTSPISTSMPKFLSVSWIINALLLMSPEVGLLFDVTKRSKVGSW